MVGLSGIIARCEESDRSALCKTQMIQRSLVNYSNDMCTLIKDLTENPPVTKSLEGKTSMLSELMTHLRDQRRYTSFDDEPAARTLLRRAKPTLHLATPKHSSSLLDQLVRERRQLSHSLNIANKQVTATMRSKTAGELRAMSRLAQWLHDQNVKNSWKQDRLPEAVFAKFRD